MSLHEDLTSTSSPKQVRGQNLTRRTPTANSLRPPSPRYGSPQPMSLSNSPRDSQHFPQVTPLLKQISEGHRTWFPKRPSSQGFALQHISPLELCLASSGQLHGQTNWRAPYRSEERSVWPGRLNTSRWLSPWEPRGQKGGRQGLW